MLIFIEIMDYIGAERRRRKKPRQRQQNTDTFALIDSEISVGWHNGRIRWHLSEHISWMFLLCVANSMEHRLQRVTRLQLKSTDDSVQCKPNSLL